MQEAPDGTALNGVQPQPWRKVLDDLVAMQRLADDWDGQGASAPSGELLRSALGLAKLLQVQGAPPPSCAVAGTSGTIVFIWQVPDGTYGEVEIVRPFHGEVMWIHPGKPAEHWEIPTTYCHSCRMTTGS